MQTGTPWRFAGAALLGSLFLHAPNADAHGAAPTLDGAPTPPSPPGDGATAQTLIADVESRAKDPELARVVAASLAKAKNSLERARGARASGDTVHAHLLDGLALEFAETARDLLRAVTAEAAASASGQKARDLSTQVERARTLLEETQARRGRAAAELDRALADAKASSSDAAESERNRLENKGKRTSSKKSDAGSPKKGAK